MKLEEIIERISMLRTKSNLSARELSLRIGKNESYINRLEYRKDFEPSISVINDIVEACGSSLEEFFYTDIENYKKDKEIIEILKQTNEKKKQAIIDLLKN
jgi:transcriptional regulator with XRE-family HTH domain